MYGEWKLQLTRKELEGNSWHDGNILYLSRSLGYIRPYSSEVCLRFVHLTDINFT